MLQHLYVEMHLPHTYVQGKVVKSYGRDGEDVGVVYEDVGMVYEDKSSKTIFANPSRPLDSIGQV